MQVDELIKPFPLKEFHPMPRSLVMTSGLRGTDIVHKLFESLKYHGLDPVRYDQVESNPKDDNVMDSVALYPSTTATASSPLARPPAVADDG
jgi:methanol:N,N-dimethyl-4-nitrosoaniline oxidoreductase